MKYNQEFEAERRRVEQEEKDKKMQAVAVQETREQAAQAQFNAVQEAKQREKDEVMRQR